MLKIEIPSREFDFNQLQQLDIPKPINGISEEINENAVLAFEDESDAINYSYLLGEYADRLDDKCSAQYSAARFIIQTIADDAFVAAYNKS